MPILLDLCIYHLSALSNFNLLPISQSSTFPIQSCLHLLESWIYYTHLVLMVLFCATIKRDSRTLLMFSLLSYVRDILCAIPLVCRLMHPYSCFSSHFCSIDFIVFLFVLKLFLAGCCCLLLLFDGSVSVTGWQSEIRRRDVWVLLFPQERLH